MDSTGVKRPISKLASTPAKDPKTKQGRQTKQGEQNEQNEHQPPPQQQQSSTQSPSSNDDMMLILKQLKQGQDSLKERFGNLGKEIVKTLDEKISAFKDYVDMEFASMQNKILVLENRLMEAEKQKGVKEFYEDHSIVISRLPYEEGENLNAKVGDVMDKLGIGTVDIIRCKRLVQRDHTHTPLVKVQFTSTDAKKKVLQEKGELRKVPRYKNTFLRSSQTHEERVLRQNIDTIMDEMNIRHKYRVTGSGKLAHNNNNNIRQGPQSHGQYQYQDRGSHTYNTGQHSYANHARPGFQASEHLAGHPAGYQSQSHLPGPPGPPGPPAPGPPGQRPPGPPPTHPPPNYQQAQVHQA